MTSIDSSLYLDNQTTEQKPRPDIDKDGFLKILMTQLQNQDPTSPMDEDKFVSQMATFSQLEQTMNIADAIDQLTKQQQVSPILQYSHLIDQHVSYQADGETEDTATGQVTAVGQEDGQAILELTNGDRISADALTQVSAPEAANNNADDNTTTADA